MNSHFTPAAAGSVDGLALAGVPTAAVVTASYAPDFERCLLLCETMDRHVTGFAQHYILVENGDVALFRQLESSNRVVVDERDLLPSWLHCVRDPTSLFRRRVWLSARAKPLRGWHVQQLRRIAIAGHSSEDVLVYCDSDVAFLKSFDCGAFVRDGRVRLLRRDNAPILESAETDHVVWSRNAGRVLGIANPQTSPHDYIATLIAWRRETVRAMCRHIEEVAGRGWVEAIASDRRFSECMIYGRYVDELTETAQHFHGSEEFCRVHWNGAPLSDSELKAFIDGMSPEQVAIGMQSFIGTDMSRLRRLIETA